MNPTAEIARKTARRKNARRATMIGSACLAIGMAFGAILARTGGLPLPETGEEVVVETARGHSHIAILDLDRQWKDTQTGEVITNVVNWTRP